MTIDQIICFLTVAKLKNFTKASERLFITQPALSRTITVIESELGVSLFNRTRRSVELTPAGQSFAIHCQNIINDYHQALDEAKACTDGTAGHLKIGFTSSAAQQILPILISKIKNQFYNIDIQLYDGTYLEILELLSEKRLDAGILSDLAKGIFSNLESRLISEDKYFLVVPNEHWAANLEFVHMDQILQEEFVTIDRDRISLDMPITERNLLSHTIMGENHMLNITNSAKSIPSLLLMVSCGQGITILAYHTKKFAPDSVRYIPIADFNQTFKCSLVWNNDNYNPYIEKINKILDEDNVVDE